MIELKPFKGVLKDPSPVRRDSVRKFKTPIKAHSIQRGSVQSAQSPGPDGYRLVPLGEAFLLNGNTGATLTQESPGIYLLENTVAGGVLAVCWRSVEKFPIGPIQEAMGMFQHNILNGPKCSSVSISRWNEKADDVANRLTSNLERRSPDSRVRIQGATGGIPESHPRLGVEYTWYNGVATVGTKVRIWTPALWVHVH